MTDLSFALNADRRATKTPLTPAQIAGLMALYGQGDFAQVVDEARTLAARHAPSLDLHNICGAACVALGDFAGAEASFRAAIAIADRHAELHNNLGAALEPQGKLDAAAAAYQRALALAPDHASTHYNLGNVRRRQHALAEAMACYERALALKPDYVEALNNLGLAHQAQNALPAARACFERALAIRPDYVEAHNNLGLAFKMMGEYEQAMQCYRQALAIKPDSTMALQQIATVLLDIKDYDSAIRIFAMLLQLDPDNAVAARQMAFAQMHVCDFSASRNLPAPTESIPGRGIAIPPFIMLPFFDDPAQQLAYSQLWAQSAPRVAPAVAGEPAAASDRIRVGYFSADFHSHATLFLMAGLLREHDRAKFEIIAYSYGEHIHDGARAELTDSVDRFIDVRDRTDDEVASLVRNHGLDIAIDLKGYTEHSRSHLFSARLAPVQINYLGYPGTMGADEIDYLIADPVVVPEASRPFYSEKIIYLPGSYQPNDSARPIADTGQSRASLGLPEDAFVFCCFNHTYKICPEAFDAWMRLLRRVEGSVLWLLGSNPSAEANLRREAALRGVDPDRLVFAGPMKHHEHLGRLRFADLFIDTFAVNAHTTASDALWAGLPVVTLAGRQFAARVGASLLHAVGLPELVTEDVGSYEALIADLAADPARLAALRAKLAGNRTSQPLFDTKAYTAAIESAFAAVHQRRLDGLAPADITV